MISAAELTHKRQSAAPLLPGFIVIDNKIIEEEASARILREVKPCMHASPQKVEEGVLGRRGKEIQN